MVNCLLRLSSHDAHILHYAAFLLPADLTTQTVNESALTLTKFVPGVDSLGKGYGRAVTLIAEIVVNPVVNRFANEVDRAVTEGELGTAGMTRLESPVRIPVAVSMT